jgi:CRISPR-associated protein Cas1
MPTDLNVPDRPADAPPVRVMALHALAYCKRLFYLEEVEELYVADDRVYAGRALHAALEADEEGERTQLELEDPGLGLVGKVDALRRRDGSLIPYEHKRGRSRHEGGTHSAWPSDRLQVIAYAALIESATGQTIAEGRIRYHANNVTVRIPITELARADLAEAVSEARRLRESTERPPVTENERLCVRCSLAPVCLPEESRAVDDPGREPTRLFPPDRDGTSLHVLTPGARVGRSRESLVVTPPDGEPPSKHPIREIDSLILHGHAQATTQALALCADQDVPVHWVSTSGHHVASLTATAGQVQRRVRQYHALADEATCLRLAKSLARAKVEGQHRYLLRASRADEAAREAMKSELVLIRSALASIEGAASRDSLRGLEGSAASAYFPALGRLLGPSVPELLRYTTRSRRPPLDRFNALLGFGYGLLHSAVMRAILASGLEPSLGFFHTPAQRRLPAGARPDGALPRAALGHTPDRLAQPQPVGPRGRLRRHEGQGLALRRRPPQGDRPVRGPARRAVEAPGAGLLPLLRPDPGVGGPAAGEGVERRAGPVRPDAAAITWEPGR